MTECERLIKENLLDPQFLKEETRCDWRVDENTKKLWALQIDLIKQVERICRKYGLTYYLMGGGCIGAVRHGGCIPWDDDLDIALKREDYNVFVEKAPLELEEPYFFQSPVTDPVFYRPHVIIRNSNGTCISKGNQKLSCNNGICIDVFPLDGYDDSFKNRLFWKISYFKNLVAVTSYNAFSAKNHRILRKLLYFSRIIIFPFGLKHYYIKYNERCTQLSKKYTDNIGLQYAHFGKMCVTWKAKYFDSAINVPFEYTTLSIPCGYHEILSAQFGDYMQFPPIDKRGNKHLFEIDPDTPYKKYCGEKYGVKYN